MSKHALNELQELQKIGFNRRRDGFTVFPSSSTSLYLTVKMMFSIPFT